MAKNPRLHEVAKALGVQAKQLMADLAAQGHELKTHMASLEADALGWLKKKYPDLEKLLAESKKEKAEKAPSKPKAKKPSSKKMVTQRSKAQAGKKEEVVDTTEKLGRPKVEIVEKEGESVEQKVMKSGIIRRRRVEAPTAVPEPESPAMAVEPAVVETKEVLQKEVLKEEASEAVTVSAPVAEPEVPTDEPEVALPEVAVDAEILTESPREPEAEVEAPVEDLEATAKPKVEETKGIQEIKVERPSSTRSYEAPRPSGRNLSAP